MGNFSSFQSKTCDEIASSSDRDEGREASMHYFDDIINAK